MAARTRDFGDMGRRLGQAIRQRVDSGALPWPLLPAGECIRATALGASEYSVQLSGNTSYITQSRRAAAAAQSAGAAAVLCLRGDDRRGQARRGDPRAFHRLRSDRRRGRGGAGAALARARRPTSAFSAFAEGIRHGLATTIERKKPLYHHARRRRRPDARRDPARGAAGRERNPRDRRRGAVGFRLHRSRPHPHAVVHRAGHDQVAGVQRRPAPRPPAPAHPSSRSRT